MKKQIHKIMLIDLKFIRKYINNKTIKFILFIVVLFRKSEPRPHKKSITID